MRRDDTREGRNMKKTKWRRRLRGTCKWGGVTLCILFSGLLLVSERWPFNVQYWPCENSDIMVIDGGISIVWTTPPDPLGYVRTTVSRMPASSATRWHFGWFHWYREEWVRDMLYTTTYLTVPVWFLLASAILPTGYLFWTDRKAKPGHCAACGYSLTGNTSGTCPECGAETTAARAAT